MWAVHVQMHRDGEEAEEEYESMINGRGAHGTNHDADYADLDRTNQKMKWEHEDL